MTDHWENVQDKYVHGAVESTETKKEFCYLLLKCVLRTISKKGSTKTLPEEDANYCTTYVKKYGMRIMELSQK